MAALSEEDFVSVADEKFDFDISLSPASSKGDNEDEEDEVFFGPIRQKERCIAHDVDGRANESVSSPHSKEVEPSISPVTAEDFEEISKQAQLVISKIDNSINDSSKLQETCIETVFTLATEERFEVSSPAKGPLSPIKRETFCIQDSPMKQLPPAIQQRLLKATGAAGSAGPGRKARLSTSSPIRQPGVQSKATLRSKAGLAGPRSVLPSKPSVPTIAQTPSKNKPLPTDKTKFQPPSRGNLGARRSMSYRTATRMGSTEELHSDSASVTSDVSDTSLNTSISAKGNNPSCTKLVLRRPSTIKSSSIQVGKVTERRKNTSTSSSSVSSINSSITSSPMPKVSQPSSGLCGLAAQKAQKSRRSSVLGRAPEPTTTSRRSMSVQTRKFPEPLTRSSCSTPSKKPESSTTSTPRQTPIRQSIAPNSGLGRNRVESAVKSNPRPVGIVPATPTTSTRDRRQAEVAISNDPRNMKPKRLLSACSMESLLQKPGVPAGLQTPSAGREKSLPMSKMRRLSAVPTPSNRQVPPKTPENSAKLRLPQRSESLTSLSATKCPKKSPSQKKRTPVQEPKKREEHLVSNEESKTPDHDECEPSPPATFQEPGTEPALGPEQQPATSHTSGPVEIPEPVAKPDPQPVTQEPMLVSIETQTVTAEEKTKTSDQSDITDKVKSPNEVLLMDLPTPELPSEEVPLIDLSNTPDLIRTATAKANEHQLIDLSSPLIKWSPDELKENHVKVAPLIDLSF